MRNKLKWADGKAVKSEIEVQVLNLLGPKTEEDLNPKAEPKKVNYINHKIIIIFNIKLKP